MSLWGHQDPGRLHGLWLVAVRSRVVYFCPLIPTQSWGHYWSWQLRPGAPFCLLSTSSLTVMDNVLLNKMSNTHSLFLSLFHFLWRWRIIPLRCCVSATSLTLKQWKEDGQKREEPRRKSRDGRQRGEWRESFSPSEDSTPFRTGESGPSPPGAMWQGDPSSISCS